MFGSCSSAPFNLAEASMGLNSPRLKEWVTQCNGRIFLGRKRETLEVYGPWVGELVLGKIYAPAALTKGVRYDKCLSASSPTILYLLRPPSSTTLYTTRHLPSYVCTVLARKVIQRAWHKSTHTTSRRVMSVRKETLSRLATTYLSAPSTYSSPQDLASMLKGTWLTRTIST